MQYFSMHVVVIIKQVFSPKLWKKKCRIYPSYRFR